MKSFRNHFSVVLSLFVLLVSLESIIIINKTITEYEKHLVDDYAIVVVATKELKKEDILNSFPAIKEIKILSSEVVLNRLKKDLSPQNISLLESSLPNFYTLKLTKFPTSATIDFLRKKLLSHEEITKVEIFSKTYDKVYKVLRILNVIATVFTFFISIISLLLILKQMKIWTYEHEERINIMGLFGAPFWTKSAVLYRLAIVDSFVATLATLAIFSFIKYSEIFNNIITSLQIDMPKFSLIQDGVFLLLVALGFALFSVSFVVSRIKFR